MLQKILIKMLLVTFREGLLKILRRSFRFRINIFRGQMHITTYCTENQLANLIISHPHTHIVCFSFFGLLLMLVLMCRYLCHYVCSTYNRFWLVTVQTLSPSIQIIWHLSFVYLCAFTTCLLRVEFRVVTRKTPDFWDDKKEPGNQG